MTISLLAALIAIYLLEAGTSASGGHPGRISHSTLVKLGGVSRDLALRHFQLWPVLTSSLLHANPVHLIGNAAALLFVGLLLEPVVGRAWFALIYVVGGVGGAVGSLTMNSAQLLSVGASGAIMCLLSCALVLSFHTASFERRRRMQVLSVRVMIPALLPLSAGHGHVDYSAHLGGVVTGMILGFLLQILWAEDEPRPPHVVGAGVLASSGVLLGVGSLMLAALLPSTAPAQTAGLIPVDDMPASFAEWTAHAAKLETQYPDDPRPHVMRAISFGKAKDAAGAEAEYLAAQHSPLLGAPELSPDLSVAIRGGLVATYLQDGRSDAAKVEAAPLCAASGATQSRVMALLKQARLCDKPPSAT